MTIKLMCLKLWMMEEVLHQPEERNPFPFTSVWTIPITLNQQGKHPSLRRKLFAATKTRHRLQNLVIKKILLLYRHTAAQRC